MSGNLSIHFSELFTDTLRAHGLRYCYQYYHVINKMPIWELLHWVNVSNKKG